MKLTKLCFFLTTALSCVSLPALDIYTYDNSDLKLFFFDKSIQQYVPHIVSQHALGLQRHDHLWNASGPDSPDRYRPEQTYVYFTDWGDDGNAGVNAIPNNLIMVELAPLTNVYDNAPTVERYHHLFSHELTHVFMTDKWTKRDMNWRRFFGEKVPVDKNQPITALFSYFTAPRWYNPRWFQEGIACFLETAMDGGVGRALGTYDEMYFRSLVHGGHGIYSAVGLETEGTSADYQLGATSYLYGTRFNNFLAYRYGTGKLFEFYNRTPDSRSFFSSQFRKVYDRRLIDVWNEWREFEKEHDKANLETIAEYPLTPLTPLFHKPMGAVCKPIYDGERERLYLAANYMGSLSHVGYIDLKTGKEHKLRNIEGPMAQSTTYMAFDKKRDRLFFNIQNSQFRGIEVIDASSGKRLKRLLYQRVSNLTYDRKRDCLYAIMSNAGINHLIRYDADLETRQVIYTFSFGETVSDLTLSNSCDILLAQLTKPNGNNCLITFSVDGLAEADLNYTEVMELDHVTLLNFTFMPDDSCLVGSSNYTGVQNIWSIDLETKQMDLLTNVETGMFAPIPYGEDSLIALNFNRDGMLPVKFERRVIHDANSIKLLGQLAYEANPELEKLSVQPEDSWTAFPEVTYADVYNNVRRYRPVLNMRFAGAVPQLSGFRDKEAFNSVTPVLGYSVLFKDPIGLSTLKVELGASPWSHNPWNQRWHALVVWDYWNWTFKAAVNEANFYDLVGPMRKSRSGYNLGVSYKRTGLRKVEWSFGANAMGHMEALPLFQEIASPVTSLQTIQASVGKTKTRASMGGVTAEQGYSWSVGAYSYFAFLDGAYKAFPSLDVEADKGWLLPLGRHNTFWLRTAAGQAFGKEGSVFSNSYFGGFRNNYVDNGTVCRYRTVNAMPGAKIDEIAARSYAKVMGEFSFTPIRFKEVGYPGFYPSYGFMSLFAADLMANPWGKGAFDNYLSVGAQFNLELVLFSYMKTTWSVGYGELFGPSGKRGGELMLSLKLL